MKQHIYVDGTINVKAHAGSTIRQAIQESIDFAGEFGCLVILEFNNRRISCEPWDDAEFLALEFFARKFD